MDFEALYRYRFQDVNQESRNNVWREISEFIHQFSGSPQKVLDPGCGLGEFINYSPASERWASDLGMNGSTIDKSVKFISGSFLDIELPDDYFDLIFISNVLEHLVSQVEVNDFLQQARRKTRSGGRIIIMGPNYKYCAKEYFDCADHSTILTHISIEEHLVTAGFSLDSTIARFIPYSFRSNLPSNSFITRFYLKMPLIWKIFGKQFLVMASKS
jgi:SAM-dependent methyltransferase